MKIKFNPAQKVWPATNSDSLRSEVTKELRILGVPLAEKPVSKVGVSYTLPPDITRVTSADLSRMMGHIANQDAYLLQEMAMWQIDANEANVKFSQAEARVISKNTTLKEKYRVEAVCEQDETVRNLRRACLHVEGVIASIKATSEGLHAKSAVLSREITRRQMEAELAHKL